MPDAEHVCDEIDQAFISSEHRYRRLFEAAKDGILLLDADTGQITDVNPYLIEMLGYTKEEFVLRKIWEIGPFQNTDISKAGFKTLQDNGYIHFENMPLKAKDGRLIDVEFVSNVYLVEDAKVIQCNIRNISERKKAEEAFQENRRQLEEQNILLEQKNAALKEMLNQHHEEKEKIESQVYANIDSLVNPVLSKLKKKGGHVIERYVELLEANLSEITSGFGKNISSRMFSLTQKEIDISNMIKFGFSSKQIAEANHISARTVETHRNSIRQKLKLTGKEMNLQTYLKLLK